MSLDTGSGTRKGVAGHDGAGRGTGAHVAAAPAVDFGSFIDSWVQCHPFSLIGNGVFGRLCAEPGLGCSSCCYCSRCPPCCCCSIHRQGAKRKSRRNKKKVHDSDNAAHAGHTNGGTGNELERASVSSPSAGETSFRRRQHRRRARVLIRAVGETLVLDFLFLALAAISGGGWNGSLASLAGISAVFSVLQLLTEMRYYVKEASSALVSAVPAAGSRDGGGGGSSGGSAAIGAVDNSPFSDRWNSWSSSDQSGSSDDDDDEEQQQRSRQDPRSTS